MLQIDQGLNWINASKHAMNREPCIKDMMPMRFPKKEGSFLTRQA